MNIGFITDTNILKQSKNQENTSASFFDNTKMFIEYVDSLEKTSSRKKLIYFMPNIIIEELYYQKLRAFEIRYQSFSERYEEISYGLIDKLPKCNIKDVLNKEKEEYKEKIQILELPYNKNIFKELTEDALRKNPPFDKSTEGLKTDSGFKDALIWKTIIYSRQIDECEKIYLFSGDNIFKNNEEYLKKEFNKFHANTELNILFIKPDGNQRQNCLQTIINQEHLLETEIIKLYDWNLILNHIKDIKYDYKKEICYYSDEKNILKDIHFFDFLKEDFEIDSVTPKEKNFEVIVYFNTNKYEVENAEVLEQIGKKKLKGKIKLIFRKNNNRFKLESYNLFNINFESTITEIFNNISKAMIQICNSRLTEALGNMLINIESPLKNIKLESSLANMIEGLNVIKPSFEELEANNISKLKMEAPLVNTIEEINSIKPSFEKLAGCNTLKSKLEDYNEISEQEKISDEENNINKKQNEKK